MSALNLPSGAASAKPVKPVASYLCCSSCRQPVFNAFQTPHGCRLCESCADKLPERSRVRCPGKSDACKDEEEQIDISRGDCFPDIAARREIGRLRMRCPNGPECQQEMKWSQVGEHLDACEYQKVACSKCGQQVTQKLLDRHKSDECEMREVPCGQCGQSVVFKRMAEHNDLTSPTCCQEFRAPCPFCGKGSWRRREFEGHKSECDQRPERCPFWDVGCKQECRRSGMVEHCKSMAASHLELIDKRLRELGSQPTQTDAHRESAGAAQAPPATDGELKEFERKLKSLYEVFKKLQVGAATWANTTMEYEELLKAFNGINGFKGVLKSLQDRANAAGERGGGGSGRVSADSPSDANEFRQLNQRISDLRMRIDVLDQTNYEGVLMWKVENVRTHRERSSSLYSAPFFLRRFEHALRVRLFLNGHAEGEGSHLSVALVLVRGEYDDALDWPLVVDVSFRLINLGGGRDEEKRAKLDSAGKRPKDSNDISIACFVNKLCHHNQLESRFVRNDCLYLETNVELRANGASAGSR